MLLGCASRRNAGYGDVLEFHRPARTTECLLWNPRLYGCCAPAGIDEADRHIILKRLAKAFAEPVANCAEWLHSLWCRRGLPRGASWRIGARAIWINA